MRSEWLAQCLRLSQQPAHFYSGARKILRQQVFTFTKIKSDLTLADCGFTSNKMRYLERAYMHEESLNVAHQLWDRRLEQDKYGSVGVTTYNHFIKNDPNKKSKRASVMGPCIQSFTLTYLPSRKTAIDVFYRTTELFKKFPADLVFLRDVLLKDFKMDVDNVTFYFANVTCHPMYFVTLIPLLKDPIAQLELIRKKDKHFFDWTVKWTARYVCPEFMRGIQKFAQAMRVHDDAMKRIDPTVLRELRKYLKAKHPGYRADYVDPDGDEDETDS